jgi:hypothetical protein
VPRITIDDLVVNRETWRLAATEHGFAVTADESIRCPAWLTGAQGQRYTSELRLVAADEQAAVRRPTEEG